LGFYCAIMSRYILSSALCCPLRFLHKKRCSVRRYHQLFVGGIVSYLRYMCLLAHSSVQCILCFAFLRLVYPMFPFSLDYPFCIASSVIYNVYVCNNEENNDFLYDKLNKSYTHMTEIS
jgi:hypothetical protein